MGGHAEIIGFNSDSGLVGEESAMGRFTAMGVTEPTAARWPFRLINRLGAEQFASGLDKVYCDTAGTFQEGTKI